ncbi:MAG: type III pantothenate kinase [Candidatus Cloacimonetes bacterium]|nr:type III pantothenate kinase [Candidatus Cloacimonadota bacterium]MCF7814828.1 type III pantothenate kinase [Candidatus Cloacimonadota bacterium]MCF7883318.1 type III pantothenate kinase [Candidatus Cloacimonadota bacterium]
MKKNNLVIDAGNTNVVFAVYHKDIIIQQIRVETKKQDCHKYYYDIISNIFKKYPSEICCCAMSSVVPQITDIIVSIIFKIASIKTSIIDFSSDLGITFDMPDSSHLGSDLVVNAYAAVEKYNKNCIICDLGTATTIQLVSKEGCFFGAAILPGIRTSSESLFEKAAKLKTIDLETPKNLLGKTTRDALLSGIINGHLFLLEGFIRNIKNEHKNLDEIITIATGGLAQMVCRKSDSIDIIDKNLLLNGLNSICNKMR